MDSGGVVAIRVKTVLVTLLVLVVLLVPGGITAVGWQVVLGPKARAVSAERFEPTPARLERGKYLVEGPTHCFHCHTEHDLSTPELPIVQAKKGAGWVMPIPELNNIASRNITPDVETGLGSWSDDEIARAIREGVRKDGTALFPVMPYMDFAKLDDEDVKAIVVYLRTVAPVKNTVPTRSLPGPLEYLVKTMPTPITSPVSHVKATAVDRGKYLVTIAGCQGCHTPTNQGDPLPGMAFAGGEKFGGVAGVPQVNSFNLTRDPSGIAHYDESLFIETLHSGQMKGRVLSHIMPFEFFKNLADDDLRDIWAFLQAQPPVQHRVSNTDPPTLCPRCKQMHGLGELNKAQ